MTLRIGTLGAARITPSALIRPARAVDDVEVVAVAARDRSRAQEFATKHGVGRVHGSYDDLLADADVDAVYNPLPNGLHGVWTIKALQAGKHVLCEKPFAANTAEAEKMAAAAEGTGLVLMEAFHWRYHPLAARMKEIIDGGMLGSVRHIETHLCIPLPMRKDIRWNLSLAGGSTMDVGCYTISMLRTLAGDEPEVVRAKAKLLSPDIDRYMEADYRFPDGRTGRTVCSMLSARLVDASLRVQGDEGEMRVINPTAPQIFHRLTVKGRVRSTERLKTEPTYTHQLRAFAGAVLRGEPILTGPDEAIRNMRVVDAVYQAAGLPVREPAAAR